MKSLLYVTVLTGLTLCSFPAAAQDTPAQAVEVPTATLQAFERFLKEEDLEGEYVLYARSVVSKKNGKGKTTEETIMKIISRGDETTTELISHKKNGKDETEKRRKEIEKNRKKREKKGGKSRGSASFSFDLGMHLPTESYRDKYDFTPAPDVASLRVANFKPKASASDDDKLVTGKLCWNPKSLDPVWIEQTPAKLPRYIEQLWIRTEFQRVGDKITLKSVHTKGIGGILLIKRKFDVLIEIRDYKP